jgi:hypothetical protein
MNWKKWLFAIVLLILCGPVFSQQLSLGNNPYFLRKSAVLELNSNNQGLLMPRISDTSLINALLPPDAMMIYFVPLKQIMVRTNGYWEVMPTASNINVGWSISGNTGVNKNVHFLGTLDDQPMIIKSNNQPYWEFGRRQTLGLYQNYPDYTDNNEKVTYLRSALQFEAAGAEFYKPKMFVDANGNFRMKGSSAGTDYFEFGATGSANNGGFEFVIGDDGDEPIIFKSYDYRSPGVFNEMMRLQSGRMGIATTSPTERLHVTGNIRFSGALMPNNLPGTSGYILRSNGANAAPTWIDPATISSSTAWSLSGNAVSGTYKLGTTSNHDLPFYTNNTEGMRLTAGNRLGIGTTSPAEVLDVNGNIKISGGNRRLIFGNLGGDPDALIELRNYAGGEKSELLFYSGNDPQTSFGPDRIRMVAEEFRVQSFGTDQGSLANAENENGVNTRFYIDPNGNVAIGATPISGSNPEKLLIDAGTTSSYNLINAEGSINNYLQFNIQNNSNGTLASSDIVATANNGNESVNYIDMGINSSGFTNTSYPIIGGQNTTYLYGTGSDMVIGNASSGRNLRLFTGGTANTNERVRIESDGDVGINTTTPTAKLDVNGTFKLGAIGTVLNNMTKATVTVNDATTFNYTSTRIISGTVNGLGLTPGCTIILNPRDNLPTGISIAWARSHIANGITIGFTNSDSAPRSVGSMVFDITVIQ